MIAIRIFMGPLFDRYNRAVLAAMALVGYATSLFLLGVAHSDVTFYLAALLYGLSLGMVVPLLNALMLLASPGEYREFNTNMMVEAMDVGFVAGPFLCGMALSSGLTLSLVLMVCGGVAGGAVLLVLPRRGKVALP